MKKPISTRRALVGAAIAAAAGAALALPSTGMGGVAAIQDDVLTTAPITEIPPRLQLVKQHADEGRALRHPLVVRGDQAAGRSDEPGGSRL